MNATRAKYYAIGGVIKVEILDKTDYFNRYFDNFDTHYENFRIEEKPDNIDISVEIGQFKPNISNNYEVGNCGFFCNEDSIYVPLERFKGAKWRFEIEGLNSTPMRARISCNGLGRIFITGNVIDALIHLKLLEKRHPIIHASAVSHNNAGYVFSSIGGGGKTTTAMRMATQGFDFLGDNFIMLNNGEALSFPTSLSIFTYNITPAISNILAPKEKLKFEIKKMIFQSTGGRAKFFTKINPMRVFKNIVPRTKFRYGFFLVPNSDEKDPTSVERSSRTDFVRRVTYNQKLEFSHLDRYLKEYSFFYPDNRLSSHWDNYTETLVSNLPKDAEYYTIFLRRKPFTDIPGLVKEITEEKG